MQNIKREKINETRLRKVEFSFATHNKLHKILICGTINSLIGCIGDRFFLSRQFKKIKKAGYKISKAKVQGKKVYLFIFKLIVIKFLPNEIHDISFDGGETYTQIIESNIGTPQEIEYLRNLKYQYQTSDYRDRDMYDSTESFIKFILKNITLDK